MFLTILIVALFITGITVIIFGLRRRNNHEYSAEGKNILQIIGGVVMIVALIITVFASTTIVKPREIGVKVALGKPVGEPLRNGLHLKAPWETVEKLDAAVQNDLYEGQTAIPVRLANNGRATVNASIEWQLKEDEALDMFLDYKTFAKIQINLVDRNFNVALNDVTSAYDPLNANSVANGGKDLSTMAEEVKKQVQAKVGNRILIRSVALPIMNFDDPTQGRINELQAETAKTRVAQQKKQTSTAEAEANKILEASVTAETLTSKCLDIVAESKLSPIGCFPGTAGVQPITMVGEAQK